MNEALRRSAAHVFVADLGAPVVGDDDAHHLGRVLRLRRGEQVTASDGAGSWRPCTWTGDGLEPDGEIVHEPAPTVRLAVALCPVKGDGTDDAVTALVEIGIDEIVVLAPLDHGVVRWEGERAASHMERLVRLVRAAAMQSRRVHLPVLRGPVGLADVVSGEGVALAEPGGGSDWSGVTTVVVGPEGGFSAAEVATAPRTVSLGTGILRADTAAVAAGVRLVVVHRG